MIISNAPKTIHQRLLASVLIGFVLAPPQQCSSAASGKVVDFGDKLPDYIKENPHKGWLIKFYTPWCYNCQQIELTYIEVAERIYHAHDHLIVGQVNCDKYDRICRQFNVGGVPTILYLRGDQQQSKYSGLRDVNSIVSFAERMNGPDVNIINDCNQIIPEVEKHGLLVVHSSNHYSSSPASNDYDNVDYRKAFSSIAAQLKRDFWFYKLNNSTCGHQHDHQGVYIVKRNLRRWIKFEQPSGSSSDNLDGNLREFILRESFPVFGPLSNHMMNSTKLLAVAVLDEYGPAKKLDLLSKKFYKVFEQVAIDEAQKNDQILFAWSTDLHTIRKIALSHVRTPNVILLRPDLSHNLLIKLNDKDNRKDESEKQLPQVLTKKYVAQFIQAARKSELEFTGGDTYFHRLARYIYSYIIMVKDRYEANPVLTSLMLISMATTTIVLLYKTKTYLKDAGDNDDENIDPQNIMPQSNHRKQD